MKTPDLQKTTGTPVAKTQFLDDRAVRCTHCGGAMRAQPCSHRVYTCGSQEDGGAREKSHLCQGRQHIYRDAIERDFFAIVLSQNPVEFLPRPDQQRRAELDTVLAELAEKFQDLVLRNRQTRNRGGHE
jgi:hypothetical protein